MSSHHHLSLVPDAARLLKRMESDFESFKLCSDADESDALSFTLIARIEEKKTIPAETWQALSRLRDEHRELFKEAHNWPATYGWPSFENMCMEMQMVSYVKDYDHYERMIEHQMIIKRKAEKKAKALEVQVKDNPALVEELEKTRRHIARLVNHGIPSFRDRQHNLVKQMQQNNDDDESSQ